MTSTHKTRCSADGDTHQSLTEIPLHRLTLTIKTPQTSKPEVLVRMWRDRNTCALLVRMYSGAAVPDMAWGLLSK